MEAYCNYCELRSSELKFCGGCRLVFYCSEGCQSSDWVAHKGFCRVNAWSVPRDYGELVKDVVDSKILDSKNGVWGKFSSEVVRLLDEAVEVHSLNYPAVHKDRYHVITNAEGLQLRSAVFSSRSVWDKLFGVSKRLCLVGSLFLPGMGNVCDWRHADLVLARLSFGLTCEDVEDLKSRFLDFRGVSVEGYCLAHSFLWFVLKGYVVSDEFALRKFPFVTCLSFGCVACQSLKSEMNAVAEPWFGLGGVNDRYSSVTDLDAAKLLLYTSRL